MNFKLKISIFSGLLVFLSFQIFFLLEYFYFLAEINFMSDGNFHIARFLISISFSFLTGLFIYIFSNNFYESLREFSHKVQVWGNTLEKPNVNSVIIKKDSDIESLEKFFDRAVDENEKKIIEKFQRELEKNNTLVIESFKPFLPTKQLSGVEYLDASIFPSITNNIDYDLVQIIETEKGFILILCGFEKSEIFESIFKLRLKSVFSTLENLYYFKEEEILKSLEKIVQENFFSKLRLSIHYIPNTSSHFSSLHFKKIPMLVVDDFGISITSSEDSVLPENSSLKFYKTVFEKKSYLILISDHIIEKLNISSKEFIIYLETEVLAKPIFTNSKELLYQISLSLEKLAKTKNLENILEWFFAIVIFKK